MKLLEYEDKSSLMAKLAEVIADDLRSALETQDRASLSVPGGTTPGPIFDALSKIDLGWDRVDVILNDERWVPEISERSNTTLLKNRLFQDHAAEANLVPLYAPVDTPEEGLDTLAADVDRCLPLSVLLLGMGADMHTASLFPGADKLREAMARDAPTLLPMRAPGAPEPRITLSARVLKGAAVRHLVIIGDEKRAALERALEIDDPIQAPVSAVLDGTFVHWTG